MTDEFDALIKNKTWGLVPRHAKVNLIHSMWIIPHKNNYDGSFERYKARLVGDGRSQQVEVDWDEKFCLVVKLATIRTVLTSSDGLRKSIMARLNVEFAMKDLDLSYFLGVAVTRTSSGMFLSQKNYAADIIERAGALQYLIFTRPDISYAAQQACLHMRDPKVEHMNALKCIVRYIQGTIDFGLYLYKSSLASLISYTDADWGGCPNTRRSTSGYCIFMGDNLLSWSSKRQPTLSKSSAEAEYHNVANVVSESCWLHNLLLELRYPIRKAILVYCDNVSVIYLTGKPSSASAH
ncbi:uncharacterized mitochondrial protein AtMg00810-like [Beta vulgaris subsp. vulgaris]|uniref:uncharacterized mitochondrial protein AtMg00810-like n=1 Tax=Beta vulgaris subsp. vulgaris TaxID=3555 RepID=UPI00203706B1|nr:uncharacterized mitochondrial protein AtMg00810-like [Beta vulgaris subsp. vulgaris]